MGIPSYYKKLCSTVKGIKVSSTEKSIDYLWFDYNCLIYYVLKSMPTYTPQDADAWEAELIKRTCAIRSRLSRPQAIHVQFSWVWTVWSLLQKSSNSVCVVGRVYGRPRKSSVLENWIRKHRSGTVMRSHQERHFMDKLNAGL